MWNFLKLFNGGVFWDNVLKVGDFFFFHKGLPLGIKDLVLLQICRALEEICLTSLKIIVLFHDVFKEDLYVGTTGHLHSKAGSLLLPHCQPGNWRCSLMAREKKKKKMLSRCISAAFVTKNTLRILKGGGNHKCAATWLRLPWIRRVGRKAGRGLALP